MGMDVYGKSPSTETGKCFRANVWSWRPLHALIAEIGSDLFDEEMIDLMGSNDGAGLDSQEECDELADRIEDWLETHKDGLVIEDKDEHVKEFVEFLRGCGGFQVC